MIGFNSLRFLMACFVALVLLWHIYDEEKGGILSTQPQVYVYGCIMPVYLLALAAVALIRYEWPEAVNFVLTLCFDTFLMISLYYCIIALLIKPLRSIIRAKSCALLWLVPNYLYFLLRTNHGLEQEKPLLIIRIPENLAVYALVIWLLGFLGFLGWKTLSHLLFRRFLLSGSTPVTQEQYIKIWESEKERLGLQQKPYRLITSANTATPLSIGLLEKATCVILPQKEYSTKELTLILRHELTHIYRGDCFTKLFLTICTAISWFNPLMWNAMQKSAEDLELSCDERVLLDASPEERRQYANLILNTAGDQRGFTSCLSASASSLRYRLKNILHPSKKRWGGFLVAGVFLVLAMCCGYVSLAYTEETGEAAIYRYAEPSEFRTQSIYLSNEKNHTTLECREPELLAQYLSGLTLNRLTGEYDFSQYDKEFSLVHTQGIAVEHVSIRDQILIVIPYHRSRVRTQYYSIADPVNWEYLQSLMEFGPSLTLHIPREVGMRNTSATLYNLDRIQNGVTETVRTGAETTDLSTMLDKSTDKIILHFSHEVLEYTVTIENWNRTEKLHLTQEDLPEAGSIPLLQPRGHYTIHALMQAEEDTVYDAEFRFDINDPAYGDAQP